MSSTYSVKYCTVWLILFLPLTASFCQEDSSRIVDVQPWFDITLYNEFSSKIEFYGDGGYRRILGVDNPWNRFYVRPSVKYAPLPWLGIRGGFALFFTDNHQDIPNTLELRPWQGVSIGWPKFRWIRFSHYFRLEQRILYNTKSWENSFILRYRYQLSSRIQPNPNKKVKYVYFPVFWEIFAQNKEISENVVELFGNENRIGAGVGYTFNKRWSAQFVFIFQRSRFLDTNFRTSDYLLRFQVRHELVPMKDMKRVEEN